MLNPGVLREEWIRNVGIVAVMMVLLFLALLLVFLYIIPLSQGQVEGLAADAGLAPTAAGRSAVADAETDPASDSGSPAAAYPVPPTDDGSSGTGTVRYEDPRFGFQLAVPERWRQVAVEGDDPPLYAADYDVVFGAPDGTARIAVSVWRREGLASFDIWMPLVASGMQPVDNVWPRNASIAGREAALLWTPESPTTPARYAAFFPTDDAFYRVAYSAGDGGAAVDHFYRALVTFGWSDEETPDVVPALPNPSARYHPDAQLFGSD